MAGQRVLLVDDEPLVLETLADKLQTIGCEVVTAASGRAALKSLHADHFDLVITDLVMEGVDGIEVLRQAKIIDPDRPVMVLTGYGDMGSAINALRLRADEYVLKNYDKDNFLMRVASCLARQELMRKVKLYEKILPVCSICKRIRDDSGQEPGKGEWMTADNYLHKKCGVDISHSLCDECLQREYSSLDNLK